MNVLRKSGVIVSILMVVFGFTVVSGETSNLTEYFNIRNKAIESLKKKQDRLIALLNANPSIPQDMSEIKNESDGVVKKLSPVLMHFFGPLKFKEFKATEVFTSPACLFEDVDCNLLDGVTFKLSKNGAPLPFDVLLTDQAFLEQARRSDIFRDHQLDISQIKQPLIPLDTDASNFFIGKLNGLVKRDFDEVNAILTIVNQDDTGLTEKDIPNALYVYARKKTRIYEAGTFIGPPGDKTYSKDQLLPLAQKVIDALN